MKTLFENKNINFIPFLNSLSVPVILIDHNNTYLSANDKALPMLSKDRINLQDQRIGDVFSCENSKLPGRCGHTKNCGGCQMLQLIKNTYEGKRKFENVPVTLKQKIDNIQEELNLKLSAEKVNDFVLLRIDQFSL